MLFTKNMDQKLIECIQIKIRGYTENHQWISEILHNQQTHCSKSSLYKHLFFLNKIFSYYFYNATSKWQIIIGYLQLITRLKYTWGSTGKFLYIHSNVKENNYLFQRYFNTITYKIQQQLSEIQLIIMSRC